MMSISPLNLPPVPRSIGMLIANHRHTWPPAKQEKSGSNEKVRQIVAFSRYCDSDSNSVKF